MKQIETQKHQDFMQNSRALLLFIQDQRAHNIKAEMLKLRDFTGSIAQDVKAFKNLRARLHQADTEKGGKGEKLGGSKFVVSLLELFDSVLGSTSSVVEQFTNFILSDTSNSPVNKNSVSQIDQALQSIDGYLSFSKKMKQ